MEKVAKMPKIGTEELEEQKKSELRATGEALAKRLLQGTLRDQNLLPELDKYMGESRSLVQQSLIKTLLQAISFEDSAINELILKNIAVLNQKINIEMVAEELKIWIDGYQQEKHFANAALVTAKREALAELGISGNGFIPNAQNSPEWEEKLSQLRAVLAPKLSDLEAKLTE